MKDAPGPPPQLQLPDAPTAVSATGEPSVLYWTVYKSLLTRIQSDEASVGKDLPIERVLTEHFGVSRFTIRQALDMLEQEGYIRKQRTRPARVISRSPGTPVARTLRSLSDILRSTTIKSSRVDAYEPARKATAAALLGLPAEASLYRLRLTHFDREREVGFSEVYFPASIGQSLTQADFETAANDGPLFVYPVVEARTGKRIDHATITIGAEPAARAARTALAPLLGDAPLVNVQFLFCASSVPVQLTMNWLDSRVHRITYDLNL